MKMVLLAALGLISHLAIGCSSTPVPTSSASTPLSTSGVPFASTPTLTPILTPTPAPVSALEVTEVWPQRLLAFGGTIYFELAATSKAEVGTSCELQMWSGTKAYDTVYVTLTSRDLEKGSVLTVSFDVDGRDKVWALLKREEKLRHSPAEGSVLPSYTYSGSYTHATPSGGCFRSFS